jgi:alpha-glucosidase
MGRWWNGAFGYEIYPRSFADANDDGIGDLAGIRQRLPYLEWLGVDAIWLAPFYDSPGYDHGYDVADYKAVNAIHGDIDDFAALVDDAHSRGLKVIVDIVPNHSSSHHVWFQEARKGRDNPYRDYYIWKDPAPDGGPPNNWVSHFGGPAWTLDEASGQYWCHLFLPEQPDLNWANPTVRDEFDAILRYWCDRGVDGFRIDVAHGLMKDPEFRDNPQRLPIVDPRDPSEVFNAFDHLHDVDQDSTIEIYERWRRVVDPYDAVLIGESNPRTLDRVERYVHGEGLHTSVYLAPVWMEWKPKKILSNVEIVHRASDVGISWVIDNHDSSRSATRFGGGDLGRNRSLALMTFMSGLGGFPFLWEGQELGLINAELRPEDLEDPISTRNVPHEDDQHSFFLRGRDVTRTAMPWDSSHANGFAASAEPWLHAPLRRREETVAGQQEDSASWLNRHRELLRVRKSLPAMWQAEPRWDRSLDGTARAVQRGSVSIVTNLGPTAVVYDMPPGEWALRYDSSFGRSAGDRVSGRIDVPRETTYLIERIA